MAKKKNKKPPVMPKPPVQRWLVTHKYTGGAIGTVRDQFAFGARRKSGPELQVDVDFVEVVAVGEEPQDVRELAASRGLRMHEDLAPENHPVPLPPPPPAPTDTEKRLAKLEARAKRIEQSLANLQRMFLHSRRRFGR